jgi:O-antigen/teichoic acid export membrane protein
VKEILSGEAMPPTMRIRKNLIAFFPADKLTANAAFLWASTVVGSLTGFLFWNLAAHSYSNDAVGMASAVISLALLIAGVAGLGFGNGIVRYFFSDPGREELLNTVLSFTFVSSCVFGILCVIGIGILAPELTVLQDVLPFLIFLGLVVATTQNLVFQMVFLSLKKAGITFLILFLLNVLRLGFVFILRSGLAQGIISSLMLATLISNGFGFLALRKLLHPLHFRPEFSVKVLRRIVPFSLANGVADFIFRLPALTAPIFVVEALGKDSGAHFYIAWIIGAALIAPGLSFAQSAFAEVSADTGRQEETIRRSMARSLLVTLVLSAGLAVLAPWILSLFGKEYIQATNLLRWMCLAAPFAAINCIFITAFRVTHRLGMLLLVNFLVTLFFFTPLAILPAWGLSAVGMAWAAAQGATAAIAAILYSLKQPSVSFHMGPA